MIKTHHTDKIVSFLLPLFCFMLPISTFGTTVCLLTFVLLWLFTGDYIKKVGVFWQHPIAQVFFILMLISFISLFYTVADSKESYHGIKDSLRLGSITVFIYFFSQQSTEKLKNRCIQAFIFAMLLTAFLSYLKYFFHLLPHKPGLTEAAVFKNHIKTSFFMSMAAFFMMNKLRFQPKSVLLWFGSLCLLGNILFLSEARIGYVIVAFLMGYFFWHHAKVRKLIMLTSVLLTLIFIMQPFSLKITERINQIPKDLKNFETQQDVKQSSIGSRLKFIEVSKNLIREKPLLGWGVGGFREAYSRNVPDLNLKTDNPHNEYLRIAVEFGVLGIAWFIFFIIRVQHGINNMPTESRFLIQGIWLICLMGCMVNSWLMDFSEGMFIILMLSMFLGKVYENNVVNHRHNIQLATST